ncbi:MAG: hypothetical protein WC004_03580 [Candidatus Absconditabacterales bacterium]
MNTAISWIVSGAIAALGLVFGFRCIMEQEFLSIHNVAFYRIAAVSNAAR